MMKTVRQAIWRPAIRVVSCLCSPQLRVDIRYVPKSFTWITLPSFSPKLSTVVFLSLGTSVPSSFVIRRR